MAEKKGIWNAIVAGIVIALVSGYASYLFGKSTIKTQTIRDQRALAYAQLVDNRALIRRFEESLDDYEENENYIKARALYNAALYRVLIFGERRVVLCLGEYDDATGDDTKKTAARLFQAMRHDLLSDSEHVDDSAILKVLW